MLIDAALILHLNKDLVFFRHLPTVCCLLLLPYREHPLEQREHVYRERSVFHANVF